MSNCIIWLVLTCSMSSWILMANRACADVRSKTATEVAEYVTRKFGKEAVEDSVGVFGKRVATASARHGKEVLVAVEKIGPRGLLAIEEAGQHGHTIARLIATHGDDAVVWVAKHHKGMEFLARHGEIAGVAMCKHKAIAEPLIEKLGEPAVHALSNVSAQNGRRLAIMAESGELAKIGKTEQLLGIIGKYGDKAGTYVWSHKGALMVSAGLATFLSNPEPFINGTVHLAEPIVQIPGRVVDGVVAPIAQAPAKALVAGTEEAAKRTDWTIILGLLTVGTLGVVLLRMTGRSKLAATSNSTVSPNASKENESGNPSA